MTRYDLGQVVGEEGNGIVSISKTDTTGLVDTYTITYTNGNVNTFTVTNGKDGEGVDLADEVTEGDTTHAVTGDAVYQYVESIIGGIIDDMES